MRQYCDKKHERSDTMEIAIIADDTKKELMTDFCIAYCGILCKHSICATATTANYITEATGLSIERMMPGARGGAEQIASRIAFNEIDVVLFFRDTSPESYQETSYTEIMRNCDLNKIPVATNIASAEIIVRALESGDLDWRQYVNPKTMKK